MLGSANPKVLRSTQPDTTWPTDQWDTEQKKMNSHVEGKLRSMFGDAQLHWREMGRTR